LSRSGGRCCPRGKERPQSIFACEAWDVSGRSETARPEYDRIFAVAALQRTKWLAINTACCAVGSKKKVARLNAIQVAWNIRGSGRPLHTLAECIWGSLMPESAGLDARHKTFTVSTECESPTSVTAQPLAARTNENTTTCCSILKYAKERTDPLRLHAIPMDKARCVNHTPAKNFGFQTPAE